MQVAIMQPTYLPWIGYFDLMDQVDLFVYLDNVQFSRQSWQQRNRIKTVKGLEWLTVPVAGHFAQLQHTPLAGSAFARKHARSIEVNYGRAACFDEFFPGLSRRIAEGAATGQLVELNVSCIELIAEALGIRTPRVRASTLRAAGTRGERVLEICVELGASGYLSPIGAAEYLLHDRDRFAAAGVSIHFQSYDHPEYRQLFPPFVPFASAIDAILNEGAQTSRIMRAGRRAPRSAGELQALAAPERP
jgi:WbqC-like protein